MDMSEQRRPTWTFESFWAAFQTEWRTRHPQTPAQRAAADDGLLARLADVDVRVDSVPSHASLHIRIPAPQSNRGIAHTETRILRLDAYLPVTDRDPSVTATALLTILHALARI